MAFFSAGFKKSIGSTASTGLQTTLSSGFLQTGASLFAVSALGGAIGSSNTFSTPILEFAGIGLAGLVVFLMLRR